VYRLEIQYSNVLEASLCCLDAETPSDVLLKVAKRRDRPKIGIRLKNDEHSGFKLKSLSCLCLQVFDLF
jgi:hypothetical protein